ncbi:unnamed protein product [Allacma fusca]|uniref:Uncharacterized protein n=1 Tax=Allacma fusca TaxID=39272 RepID=A0A8J2LAT2_9HEXA|nr:unnamed protein product [Allacma fusca]
MKIHPPAIAVLTLLIAFQQCQSKPHSINPTPSDDFYNTNAIEGSDEVQFSSIEGQEVIADDRQIFEAAASATESCPEGKAVKIGDNYFVCATDNNSEFTSTRRPRRKDSE